MEKSNYDKRSIPTYLLGDLLTLITKELRISVEQARGGHTPYVS